MSLHSQPQKLDSVEELPLVFSDNVLTAGNRFGDARAGARAACWKPGHITFQQSFAKDANRGQARSAAAHRSPTKLLLPATRPHPQRRGGRLRPPSTFLRRTARVKNGGAAQRRHRAALKVNGVERVRHVPCTIVIAAGAAGKFVAINWCRHSRIAD